MSAMVTYRLAIKYNKIYYTVKYSLMSTNSEMDIKHGQ